MEVTPETERVVREEFAKGRFRSLDDLIVAGVQALSQQIRHGVQAAEQDVAVTSGVEKARRFVDWAKSHPAAGPPLSDEALSRATLNPDRW